MNNQVSMKWCKLQLDFLEHVLGDYGDDETREQQAILGHCLGAPTNNHLKCINHIQINKAVLNIWEKCLNGKNAGSEN